MFALIEGLSFGQIGSWVLHKVGFGVLAAKAIGLARDRRVDGAIRLHVFVIGQTPGTHVAELASRGISRGGKSQHECDRKCGLGNARHSSIPCEETCENGSHTAPYVNAELPRLVQPIRNLVLEVRLRHCKPSGALIPRHPKAKRRMTCWKPGSPTASACRVD